MNVQEKKKHRPGKSGESSPNLGKQLKDLTKDVGGANIHRQGGAVGREPVAAQKQVGTKLTRKYSDNKYDKPEYEAKIEQ